jgi:hypothetical protein
MALSSVPYTGDGATTNYSYNFGYVVAADIKVYIDGVLQVLTTDYTWFNESTIAFNVAPLLDEAILFQRRTENLVRLVDFQDAGNLTEADLDLSDTQLFYLMQEAQDDFTANAMVLDTDTKWEGGGFALKNLADGADPQDAVTIAYGDANYGEAARAAAEAQADAAAASAAAALVSEDAAAADLVLTNADVVSTGDDLVLTNADVVSAEAARVAAVAAQTAAELALDNFDDIYLGAFATAPTLDNDGDALATGAMYFNTAANTMYVYDAGWQEYSGAYVLKAGDTLTGNLAMVTASFTEQQHPSAGTTETIDWNNGLKQRIDLNASCTISFTDPVGATNMMLLLRQGASTSYTVTWPSDVDWPAGEKPVFDTGTYDYHVISLYYDGNRYYGAFGLNYF